MMLGKMLENGQLSLFCVYIMLLKGRCGYHRYVPEKNSNGKITSGKRLLSKKSGVSLTAIDMYLPQIIDMGLGHFNSDGGFTMLGSKKIDGLYASKKKVPVRIGKNLRITKGNLNAVIITASIYRQVKQIERKITLNKALCQERKGKTLSRQQSKAILNAAKSESINIDKLNKVENLVLSNKGFSKAIRGLDNNSGQKMVSHGGYWRKVLSERGFIASRRRYETVYPGKVSFNQYLSIRKQLYNQYGFVTYKKGRIVKPIVSEVSLITTPILDKYNTTLILFKKNSVGRTPVLDIVNQNENRL